MRDDKNTTPGGIHIDDGGKDGIPVLFVHSAGGSTEHWTEQLAHLRGRGRRAIAIDLRGHGRSRLPADGDFTIPGLASDILAVLDHLGLRRVVLVGHSMGGAVVTSFAGSHPDRVAGLLLLDPASDGREIPAEQAQGLMASMEGEGYREAIEPYWSSMLQPSSQEVRQRLFDGLWRTPRQTVVETLRGLLTFDPVAALSRYRGPRLSIITPFNRVPAAYHALVPDLPHRDVEGTGHWLHLDQPDRINREIDEFLNGVG